MNSETSGGQNQHNHHSAIMSEDGSEYEGGGPDSSQLSYFQREARHTIQSGGDGPEATEAEIKILSGLEQVQQDKLDWMHEQFSPEVTNLEPEKVVIQDGYSEEDEKLFETNDKRPLGQLKMFSEKYAGVKPSLMFLRNHTEQLRKYADPSTEFNGQIVFYKEHMYVVHAVNKVEDEGAAYMVIKRVPLADKLDFLPNDIAEEDFQFLSVVQELKHVSIESAGAPSGKKSSGQDLNEESISMLKYYIHQAESSRKVEIIQNGQHIYFWSMNVKQSGGKDYLGQLNTSFDLVEVDLESGQSQVLKEFSIKVKNSQIWLPLSVCFPHRHSRKEFPFDDFQLVKRNDFVASLKKEVVCVRDAQINQDYQSMRVSLRNLKNFDVILYQLSHGQFNNNFTFISQINTEDILRLQDKVITNKLQVKSHERLAKNIGVLYLTKDHKYDTYFNLVQVNKADDGSITNCSHLSSVKVNPTKLENFKQRVLNYTFKYLYDEDRQAFFIRKTNPIKPGAIIISDLILNKLIFLEVTQEDKLRLKATNLRNHGLSFQKIGCYQLCNHNIYENFRKEYMNLSQLIAENIAHLDHKYVTVSQKKKNMFRSEGQVFFYNEELNKLIEYEDTSLKVKSFDLNNQDYILNPDLRGRVFKQIKESRSYLKFIPACEWQSKYRKTFVGTSWHHHLKVNYKRLVSSSGEYLLPRAIHEDRHSFSRKSSRKKMISPPTEPIVELFKFKVAGQLQTDSEDEIITADLAWKVIPQRVRFENDFRNQRPLIFSQGITDELGNFQRQHFWFCIYDFKSECIDKQVYLNFPDLIKEYQIESVDVAASTEVYPVGENQVGQTFQVGFYLKHQLRVKIIEYQVIWANEIQSECVSITQIGSKEMLLKMPDPFDTTVENFENNKLKDIKARIEEIKKPHMDELKVRFIPYMDKRNRICGTQLIYGGTISTRVFVIENVMPGYINTTSSCPFVTDQGYKVYKNETFGMYSAVLAFSRLSDELLNDTILTKHEKVNILEDSIKAMLNSVIYDPSIPIPWQLGQQNFDKNFLKAIDLGRGVEIFDWFSIVSLKCDSQELQSILDSCKRKYEDKIYDVERFSEPTQWTFSSLMERVLVGDLVNEEHERIKNMVLNGQIYDYDRIKTLQLDQMYIKGHEIIQRDIFLNHPIHYLLDIEREIDVNIDANLDLILQFTFSEFNNSNLSNHLEAQEHLMSMLGDMINRPNGQQTYCDHFLTEKFIQDPTLSRKQTLSLNICQEIKVKNQPRSQAVPLQGFPYLHHSHEFRQNPSYTFSQLFQKQVIFENNQAYAVQKYFKEQSLNYGIDHKVECLFFDLRFFLFEQKVKHIKTHTDHNGQIMSSCYHSKPNFKFDSFDFCNLILAIIEVTQGNISNQKIIRHVTDYLYEDTKKINIWMLVGYLLGFFLPFMVQQYSDFEPTIVTCLGICMFTSLLLLRFEVEQLKIQGCEYFMQFMNWIDLMGFFSFTAYFALKVQDPHFLKADYHERWDEEALGILGFVLIFYSAQKLLFYFKMFESFGIFQNLVGATLSDIKIFLLFMFFWLCIFSTQLMALGSGYPQGDYPGLNVWVANWLQTWRNALANCAVPDYSLWVQNLRAEEKEGGTGSLYTYVIIFLIWLNWYSNLFLVFLVLLNFLISLVGNAYNSAKEYSDETAYALKSDLNQEVSLFNKWQGRDYKMDSLIIISEIETAEEADQQIQDFSAILREQTRTLEKIKKDNI